MHEISQHESEEESGVNPSYSTFNIIVRGQAFIYTRRAYSEA